MKVFVAGATGAVGRPIVRQLIERGHEVHLLVRKPASSSLHPKAVSHVGDALDPAAVRAVVASVKPAAVVSQLTRLPQHFQPRRLGDSYDQNNRVRLDGTRNLLEAAQDAGATTFLAQSSAFWYRPTPGPTKSEADPFWTEAPEPIGEAVRTMVRTEELVASAKGLRTILLRYGSFYGPGTWFAKEGEIGRRVRKRQFPLIGDGTGVTSFLHVEDAAGATVLALEKAKAGTFNVVDDEPAQAREWLPEYARALGAKPPRRVPPWLARLAIGKPLVAFTMHARGATNARFKHATGWKPRYSSWRLGFAQAMG